jgi:hypothetical protein
MAFKVDKQYTRWQADQDTKKEKTTHNKIYSVCYSIKEALSLVFFFEKTGAELLPHSIN